jgi:hypothetical protein
MEQANIGVIAIHFLTARIKMVLETAVYSPFNHVTRLLARESLNEFICCAVDYML